MKKISTLTNPMWEELKRELFMNGADAIDDFLGFTLPENTDKDTIEKELDEIKSQMPDDTQIKFYIKYVPNNSYVNDAGSIATITKEMNQYVAYVEPDNEKLDRLISEMKSSTNFPPEVSMRKKSLSFINTSNTTHGCQIVSII